MPSVSRDTRVFLSASSVPSRFGVTVYNALFEEQGVDAVYLARSVGDVGDAPQLVSALRTLSISGCSVSMPMKACVIPYLDQVDPEAAAVQSVNTIVQIPRADTNNSDGGMILKGYNTDIAGFRMMVKEGVREACGSDVKFAHLGVLVYGSGSVVDSILYVLTCDPAPPIREDDDLLDPIERVYVVARRVEAAQEKVQESLARLLQTKSGTPSSGDRRVPAARLSCIRRVSLKSVEVYNTALSAASPAYDIFVNATPLSLSPLETVVEELIKQAKVVLDLVVPTEGNHLKTFCALHSIVYVPGFSMYKGQFCRQFELYTGGKATPEDVERVAKKHGLV